MAHYSIFSLLLILLPLRAWCQTVQDSWTAPAAPDGSTSLQGNAPFTIRWKSSLHGWFETYCTECNVTGLDLWVTSFNDEDYMYKIAGNIDITTTLSYEWDGNIPTAALSANDYWVFRFTPLGATDPFLEQISSSGLLIAGTPQPSTVINTVTAQPTSATSSIPDSSSIATASIATASATASPNETGITTDPVLASTSKAWIAGVVVGPIAGMAMITGLVWLLLRKKRKNKASQQQQQHQTGDGYTPGGCYDAPIPAGHIAEEKYPHTTIQSQDSQQPSEMSGDSWHHGQYPAEVYGGSPEPAELWHGNYRSP